jgi:hypothetical protein
MFLRSARGDTKPLPPASTKVGKFLQKNETVSADIYKGRKVPAEMKTVSADIYKGRKVPAEMKRFPPTSTKVGKFPQNNETVSADIYNGRKQP